MPNSFAEQVGRAVRGPLRRGDVTTLQLNIGARCDLACRHCHVEAGPNRSEAMGHSGAKRILELLECNPEIGLLDITGGAPELNPEFRYLVRGARSMGRRVIDRSNLTVFFEPGQEQTPEFLAEQGVEVVASLPCYSAETVEQQRGRGVFDRSITALRRLNALGYAAAESELKLHLVFNPADASLPPPQDELEQRYREELRHLFGVEFSGLYTLTNMPIKRFARELELLGRAEEYMSLLVDHFNPATVDDLMCLSTVSIGYDGTLYDCDFNQALEIPLPHASPRPVTIWDLTDLSQLRRREIATASHCFGCTAGSGSSCSGALSR